jgi:hypothetical protein
VTFIDLRPKATPWIFLSKKMNLLLAISPGCGLKSFPPQILPADRSRTFMMMNSQTHHQGGG